MDGERMGGFRSLLGQFLTFLQRRLERDRVHFVCLAVVVNCLVLLVVSFASSDRGQTVFGTDLGGDYAGFYTAASILDRQPADRLYDFELQTRLYHECLPHLPEEARLPYVHPPFVALALQPLARLPYAWSFALWLLISAGLYAAGLGLTLSTLESLRGLDRITALLLAVSFEPFIMECWMGGQLSTVAFFSIALALYCDHTHQPTAAGLALGVCLYKPTLLVLLLPMLVVARRWRMLLGFGAAGLALAAISVVGAGWQNCLDYGGVLLSFTRAMTESGTVLRTWKYVDLNSFFRRLLGGSSELNWLLLLAAAGPLLLLLAVSWWQFDRHGAASRRLIWASTLAATLVANLYVGVYDTTLVVLVVLLATEALFRPQPGAESSLPSGFRVLLVLLYVVPWVTQPVAQVTGFQTCTLVLLALAVYLAIQARHPSVAGA